MKLQMLKRALISYVTNSAKAIWSAIAHPLKIISTKECNVKDYRIYGGSTEVSSIPITVRGKNLLDVNKVYPAYVNGEGGITFTRSALYNLYNNTNMYTGYKEKTRYTFSCDYETTVDNNSVYPYVLYTDGTNQRFYNTLHSEGTGSFSGHCAVTTTANKTVSKIAFLYSSAARTCDVKLTNMQLEEGATATEYEAHIEPQTIDISRTLGAGEVIQKSVDGLPNLPQFNGTTVYEVQTDTPPSGIEVCYYG